MAWNMDVPSILTNHNRFDCTVSSSDVGRILLQPDSVGQPAPNMRRIITCMARVVVDMDDPVLPVMSRMSRMTTTFKGPMVRFHRGFMNL